MALTPHKDYESYVAEAKAKGDRSVASKTLWDSSQAFKPSSGESSSASSAASATTSTLRIDRDDSGALRKSDTMELLGNAGAGQSSLNMNRFNTGDSRTLLYDDVTGNVYATGNWNDVDKNEAAWVDSRGQRFKGWGSVYGKDESGNNLYNLKSSDDISSEERDAGHNMLAAFGSSSPEPGTAEFQDWVRGEIQRSGDAQAAGNTYDIATGEFGDGTDYGHYGRMSVADWVKMGRPEGVSGHEFNAADIAELAKYSDAQLSNHTGYLTSIDLASRASGLEKTLGVDGAKIFNITAPVVAGMFSPAMGAYMKMVTAGTSAYSASGGDWGTVKNAVAIEAGTQVASAALTAATAGVGGTIMAGTQGVIGATAAAGLAGATTGAVSSAGSTLARGSLTRLTTGRNNSRMWRDVAYSGAMGGATGAVTGSVGQFMQTSSGAIAQNRLDVANGVAGVKPLTWQTGMSGAMFDAAVQGSTAYGLNRLFGASSSDSALTAGATALSSLGGSMDQWKDFGSRGGSAADAEEYNQPWAARGFMNRFVESAPELNAVRNWFRPRHQAAMADRRSERAQNAMNVFQLPIAAGNIGPYKPGVK